MLVYQRDPEGKQQRDLEEREREKKSWLVFVHVTTMFSYIPSFDRMPAFFKYKLDNWIVWNRT